ncbi:MAG: alpha/beta fold hydrolase [Alphaproteobacteria bacterium]
MSRAFRVPVNGVSLAVTDHAPGRRDLPVLVLAHATGFCGGVWEPIVPALSERFRVVTYDQRGHGDSDKPDTVYDWSAFAADLAGLIDFLGEGPVLAAGHSKGGAALAGVAARHPGRVSRAVLLDPVLVPPPVPGEDRVSSIRLAAGARRRREVWESREALVESLAARPPFSEWRRDFVLAYARHGTAPTGDGRFRLKCPGEIEARVYEGAAGSSSLEFLRDAAVPMLIVAGQESDVLPPDLARLALSTARDARLVVLPGIGHFVPMQAPERTVEMLCGFLAEEAA